MASDSEDAGRERRVECPGCGESGFLSKGTPNAVCLECGHEWRLDVSGGKGRIDVDDAGYPRDHLTDLIDSSEDRFAENVERFGPGENWIPPEGVAPENVARWHIWKACDELFQTRDAVYPGEMDYTDALRSGGDALNHLLFALDIAARADTYTTDT